ncbi:MAG: siderophore-interacting protein [Actinomycetota bacterium]
MSVARTVRQFTIKNRATVTSAEPVGDGLLHVRATMAQPNVAWKPGQAVALVVDPEGKSMKDRWRHYTVRACDREAGTIDFLMARHDASTPGGRFIDNLAAGREFTFMGPGGSPVVEHGARGYLFAGDRTSVASISAMLDSLSERTPNVRATVIMATPNPRAAALPTSVEHDVTWVAATTAEEIAANVVDALPPTIPSASRAYVTGEMTMMRDVRRALGERGLGRRHIGCHAHWTPGRRGM